MPIKNIRYIVTKPSDDGTFELGDHIKFNSDGTITCYEAGGWIALEYIDQATKGLEYEIDKEFLQKRKKELEDEINDINRLTI